MRTENGNTKGDQCIEMGLNRLLFHDCRQNQVWVPIGLLNDGIKKQRGNLIPSLRERHVQKLFETLEYELLRRHRLQTRVLAESAVFEFIEGLHNTQRLRFGIGSVAPTEYGRKHHATSADYLPRRRLQPENGPAAVRWITLRLGNFEKKNLTAQLSAETGEFQLRVQQD